MSISAAIDLKDQGNDHFRSGEWKQAEAAYTKGIESFRNVTTENEAVLCNLLVNRAACHLKLESFQACIDDCSLAIEFPPNSFSAKALYRRATAFAKLQDYSAARRDLQKLLQFEPKNTEATKLMSEIVREIQKSSPSSDVEKILEEISKQRLPALLGFKSLVDLCSDDATHSLEFGKSNGLSLLARFFSETQDRDLFSVCLRLLAILTNHIEFCRKYILVEQSPLDEKSQIDKIHFDVSSSGAVSLSSLFSAFRVEYPDLKRTVVLLIMNIFRSFPIAEHSTDDKPLEDATPGMLYLRPYYGKIFLVRVLQLLNDGNNENFGFSNEAFCAFISDQPNYYDLSKIIDTRLESLEDRKKRLFQEKLLSIRAKTHSRWAVECGCLALFLNLLDNENSFVRQGISSTIGKFVKFYQDNEDLKSKFSEFFSNLDTDESNIIRFRKRAALESCLLLTHPDLGAWALQQNDGILQLIELIQTGDLRCCEIAVEVISLAAGVDAAVVLLKPVVEANLLEPLLAFNHDGIKSNAASAITKLSIKSNALNDLSSENAQILNTVHCILKNAGDSQVRPQDSLSTTMTSVEKCIEILAALVGKSYIKEEIVHGSPRISACISELIKLPLTEGSTGVYGLAHIFAALTVTNRELRALALADKEMTVEQYDKLKELQRIKTKDENGNVIEEKKDEEDIDNQDRCNLRIIKIVGLGGIQSLLKILNYPSSQGKLNSCRALRQICVVEKVRGIFLQEGGLKACAVIANDETLEKQIRMEAAHAIAKALVTTNPNLLSEHQRLNSFRPLLLLCREVDSNQLQQFEALLSITNLLSCGVTEQDLFVDEKGVQAVHYLMFSHNVMIRRAATEAFCNMGQHEAILKILRQRDKLKLWLALCEDWDVQEGEKSENFLTARAAAGTLACAAFDEEVAQAMVAENSVLSLKTLLETGNDALIHRALVIILEMTTLRKREVAFHLMEGGIISALGVVANSGNTELRKLGTEAAKVLLEVVNENSCNKLTNS